MKSNMKFTDRIKFVFNGAGQKANPFQKVVMLAGYGSELFSRYSKIELIENGYNRNPYVKACVDRFASGLGGLPIKVSVMTPSGKRIYVKEHPILNLLDRAEGGRQGLIELYATYYKVTGDSFMQVVTNKHDLDDEGNWRYEGVEGGWQEGLIPLEVLVWPSQHINPLQGNPSVPIMGYRFSDYGTAVVRAWEIIHWKTPSLTEYWHGLSPLTPLGTYIDISNNSALWNSNMIRRGGRPDLVIMSDHELMESQKAELRTYWNNNIAGAENKDSVIPILDGGIRLENPNNSPTDMNWLEGDKHAGRIIAMGLKTPSELINDAQNKTYSNQREAIKDYYNSTLLPDAGKMWAVFNRKMSGFYKDKPIIEIDVDAIDALQESAKEKTDKVIKQRLAKIITLNESRQELQYGNATDELIEEQKLAKLSDGSSKPTSEEIAEELKKLELEQ